MRTRLTWFLCLLMAVHGTVSASVLLHPCPMGQAQAHAAMAAGPDASMHPAPIDHVSVDHGLVDHGSVDHGAMDPDHDCCQGASGGAPGGPFCGDHEGCSAWSATALPAAGLKSSPRPAIRLNAVVSNRPVPAATASVWRPPRIG